MVTIVPSGRLTFNIFSTQLVLYGVQYWIHRSKVVWYRSSIFPLSTSSSRRPFGSALLSLIFSWAFPILVPMKSFLKKFREGEWANLRYFFTCVLIMALYSRRITFSNSRPIRCGGVVWQIAKPETYHASFSKRDDRERLSFPDCNLNCSRLLFL